MPPTDLAARRTVRAAQPKRWFFDAWSFVYDIPLVQRATYRPVQDAVIEALARVPHARVLDIGCGTGLLACRVIETFPRTRVVGCDFSSGMLARAAARGPSVCWVQGDGCRLPFTDRAFDAMSRPRPSTGSRTKLRRSPSSSVCSRPAVGCSSH